MRTLDLLIALDFQARANEPPDRIEARVASCVEPLVGRLVNGSNLTVSLHLSGPLLAWLVEHGTTTLGKLIRLADAGRIEILGSGYYDPILASIPEGDASGQLQLMNRFLATALRTRPTTLWLEERAWDPALPSLLGRAGYTSALVGASRLSSGGRPLDPLDGHYVTERDGFCLSLLPRHAALTRQLLTDGADIPSLLRDILAGREGATATIAVDDIRDPALAGRIGDLLAAARDQDEWVRTSTIGEYLQRAEPAGRVYPALEPALGDEGDRSWLSELVRHPEVNFLHKRMLMASYRVQRMRREAPRLHPRQVGLSRPEEIRAVVERACTRLWRAQGHHNYWHGGRAGVYDAGTRRAAYRDLLSAERMSESLLRDAGDDYSVRWVDFDCDGRKEAVIHTPALGAIICPSAGGGMLALELPDRKLDLGTVTRRRREPYHEVIREHDIELVHADGAAEPDRPLPLLTGPEAERLWFDRRGRLSFLDHFLAPGTTLDAWYRNAYREIGDFPDATYEVINKQAEIAEDVGVIHLARNGTLEVDGARSLVRVEKSFQFSRDIPRLRVDYDLMNRYFEPAPAWFGVETNFPLSGPDGGACAFRAVCASSEVEGRIDAPRELRRVVYLELVDAPADLVVCLYFDDPIDVWCMPVETVTRTARGLRTLYQGVSLLLHGDHTMWGSEQRSIRFRIEFLTA
jgi:4-alpha-glucanotransferase